MNKRILIIALAAGSAGIAISAGAFAQQTVTHPDNTQSTSVAAPSGAATTSAQSQANGKTAKRAVPPLDSNLCIRDTGSHIKPPKGQCLPVNGNSYSQKDIQRTGATNVGQALQMLDPSVQVNGGH